MADTIGQIEIGPDSHKFIRASDVDNLRERLISIAPSLSAHESLTVFGIDRTGTIERLPDDYYRLIIQDHEAGMQKTLVFKASNIAALVLTIRSNV